MEWVCETPGESDKQVAEAVIPALKDKRAKINFELFFELRWHRDLSSLGRCIPKDFLFY